MNAIPPLVFLLLFAVVGCGCRSDQSQPFLADDAFQELSLQLSEPEGYFDTDNLISNERPFQDVLPAITRLAPQGGAYIGVGPDQNFTFIAACRPSLAFIVDIRRDNLLQHLYFKELFERAPTRADFLSLLFAKPLSDELKIGSQASAAHLVNVFRAIPSDHDSFEQSLNAILPSLASRFPSLVSSDDSKFLQHVARAFFRENLELRFRSHGRRPHFFYPTLAELIAGTDRQQHEHGYLSSPERYHYVRRMQLENRIVPVVGNLGGRHALASIGGYLKRTDTPVSLFYLSNVEFYLVQSGLFAQFQSNVAALPSETDSLLYRTVFRHGRDHPETAPGAYVTPLLQRVHSFTDNTRTRPYGSYFDLIARDYVPVFSGGGVDPLTVDR